MGNKIAKLEIIHTYLSEYTRWRRDVIKKIGTIVHLSLYITFNEEAIKFTVKKLFYKAITWISKSKL